MAISGAHSVDSTRAALSMTKLTYPSLPSPYAEALGDLDPVHSMRETADRLERTVQHASAELLRRAPLPGKWSAHEVIGHLADHEVILGARIRLVAALDRPSITGYDQDAMVARLGLEQATTARLLAAFRSGRQLTLELVDRLSGDALERVGLHTERGEESIAKMLALYAAHDLLHEAQIARALAS